MTVLKLCRMVDQKLWDMHVAPEGATIKVESLTWLKAVNRDSVWLSAFCDNLLKVPEIMRMNDETEHRGQKRPLQS